MILARACHRPLVSGPGPCLKLPECVPTSFLRYASANSRTPSTKPAKANPKLVKRFIVEEAKQFVNRDGKLLTSRENHDFLLKYDLEPDNGRMSRLSAGPELARLGSDFTALFAYSPRHVIHPFDLRFFQPRGHPLAPAIRAKYARKTREQPMWITITSLGGVSAVVRTLTQRRLTKCIYTALESLGYRAMSKGGKACGIRGSLWITIHDPMKAARQSPERFGLVVAEALAKHCSRQRK